MTYGTLPGRQKKQQPGRRQAIILGAIIGAIIGAFIQLDILDSEPVAIETSVTPYFSGVSIGADTRFPPMDTPVSTTGVGVPDEQSKAGLDSSTSIAPTPTLRNLHAPVATGKVAPTATHSATVDSVPDCGLEAQFLLSGILPTDHKFANFIIFKESSCNHLATNGQTGAVGYCQLNPHWHTVPEGYRADQILQLEWCNNYANNRYGGWQNAYQAWQTKGWW